MQIMDSYQFSFTFFMFLICCVCSTYHLSKLSFHTFAEIFAEMRLDGVVSANNIYYSNRKLAQTEFVHAQ